MSLIGFTVCHCGERSNVSVSAATISVSAATVSVSAASLRFTPRIDAALTANRRCAHRIDAALTKNTAALTKAITTLTASMLRSPLVAALTASTLRSPKRRCAHRNNEPEFLLATVIEERDTAANTRYQS